MRLLGTLKDLKQAKVLADYLLAQGIPTKTMDEAGEWELWVQNEDQMEPARGVWADFQRDPADPRFHQAKATAAAIKKQEAEAERKYQENFRTAGHLWGRPAARQVPFTLGLIALCVAVFLFTGMGDRLDPNLRWFTFTDPHLILQEDLPPELAAHAENAAMMLRSLQGIYVYFGVDRIKSGELWRLFTPALIHFGILHLAFNLYALFSLGGLVEYRRGWHWLLGFILACGVCSNVAEYLWPNAFNLAAWAGRPEQAAFVIFGGMSGVLFGLFGYLWMKTAYAPEPGLLLPRDLIFTMLFWLVLCMSGALGPIANTAHVAGLAFGAAVGAGPKLVRTLLKRRRPT